MGLDIWFADDIETRLDGIEETAAHYPESQFKMGFMAALSAVRAAFGLQQTALIIPTEVKRERQTDGGTGDGRILPAISGYR